MSLTDDLIEIGYLKTLEIIEAFRKIKRKDFLVSEDEAEAEINAPVAIGFGQTISQPATVAFMFELLEPKRGEKILDVGSGSGWTSSLLAQIVGEEGKVYGIERIRQLKEMAESNADKYDFIRNGIVKIFCSDGTLGLPDLAPFDKIIVAAAAEEIPEALTNQLKVGGRLVIPVGKQFESQDMVVVERAGENEFKKKIFPGFIFVPLVEDK
ncbi:MAG: protein-L-isoaspartate O-methyltransferase [Patescibacteria group bacterium]|nr:protein-L-isoaspartate O-methyltransferase [Patescibacteria group bacterium]MDD5554983.1 protein-L-isoaspartate O-methyltransferase [Patescibacteria group bacterium]